MSEAPKPHVYEPTTADGHCAECGHNIVASWHYVKGADYAVLRQRHAAAEAVLDSAAELTPGYVLEGKRSECYLTVDRSAWTAWLASEARAALEGDHIAETDLRAYSPGWVRLRCQNCGRETPGLRGPVSPVVKPVVKARKLRPPKVAALRVVKARRTA
jgi:hypothetical protein